MPARQHDLVSTQPAAKQWLGGRTEPADLLCACPASLGRPLAAINSSSPPHSAHLRALLLQPPQLRLLLLDGVPPLALSLLRRLALPVQLLVHLGQVGVQWGARCRRL